ncbi:MAG: PEGA domain-containing protein, partial [Myxococcota bacterium]
EPAAPVPAPEVPAAPAPAVEVVGVTFESTRPGAAVYLDGVLIGRTPVRDHLAAAGTHELRLTQDGRALTREIRVGGRRGSTRFSWGDDDQLLAR